MTFSRCKATYGLSVHSRWVKHHQVEMTFCMMLSL